MWIDGHLDLAYGALLGRDLTLKLDALRDMDPVEGQTATVSFEELRRAGVGLCLGTLFAAPQNDDHAGYTDWRGARAQAVKQLEQYQRWQDGGFIRLLSSGAEILEHARKYDPASSPLGVVLLMEGADPLRDVDDLPFWADSGVRAIGLSWGKTRFAGGTAAPGPLTDRGRELLSGMRELGVAQDLSHLDEQAFFEAAELQPRCFASHSNSRAVLKLGPAVADSAEDNRHLSDEMARAIGERGGIIGLVLLNTFLKGGWELGGPRVGLDSVMRHAEHYAELIGWDKVGLGSDLDGGFGNEKTPMGIDRASDLERLADLLPDEVREGVMGGNWLRWLGANL